MFIQKKNQNKLVKFTWRILLWLWEVPWGKTKRNLDNQQLSAGVSQKIRRLNPLWHYGSWVSLILMGLRWLVFPGSLVLSSCGAASRCTTRLAGDAYRLSRSLAGWNVESYIVLTRHKGAEPFWSDDPASTPLCVLEKCKSASSSPADVMKFHRQLRRWNLIISIAHSRSWESQG